MFHAVLVPLDGSARAEKALPVAIRLARATGGTLTLVHVVNLRAEYSTYLAQTPTYTMKTELSCAKDYLDQVVQQYDMRGVHVYKEVLLGVTAQMILTLVQRRHIELIVLCSHGYTGIKRWALGSVAQKIVRLSPIPVLVLRENGQSLAGEQTARPVRAVVALDGSTLAEAALVPTASLVAALTPAPMRGSLHLIYVLKSPPLHETLTYQQYGLDVDLLEEERAQMDAYLQIVANATMNKLRSQINVDITWSVKESSDVANELLAAVRPDEKNAPFDVLALATHGRAGFQKWIMGSVTERVLEGSRLPLLIIRPQEISADTLARSVEKREESIHA